ncbi:uncharacterized protein METZ01_LOCUS477146 [marine metagenome]|uniref:Uncharacterized protein n=1 Tax=marine metagenome TaxID=408172 RepID=A0A383BWK5_9ZZZZ|tara:strand:- start:247 stop:417 length:171 start_codon:yes stop_codon:yes gene_type:complete
MLDLVHYDDIDELYDLLQNVEDFIGDLNELDDDVKDALFMDISSMISTIAEAVESD